MLILIFAVIESIIGSIFEFNIFTFIVRRNINNCCDIEFGVIKYRFLIGGNTNLNAGTC